jgi:hypothetical protein
MNKVPSTLLLVDLKHTLIDPAIKTSASDAKLPASTMLSPLVSLTVKHSID